LLALIFLRSNTISENISCNCWCHFRDIQKIAAMEKNTEDMVRRSAEDTQVVAVIAMTTEGIRHRASVTCRLGILGVVQCDGNV